MHMHTNFPKDKIRWPGGIYSPWMNYEASASFSPLCRRPCILLREEEGKGAELLPKQKFTTTPPRTTYQLASITLRCKYSRILSAHSDNNVHKIHFVHLEISAHNVDTNNINLSSTISCRPHTDRIMLDSRDNVQQHKFSCICVTGNV